MWDTNGPGVNRRLPGGSTVIAVVGPRDRYVVRSRDDGRKEAVPHEPNGLLRAAREAAGLTQGELAERANRRAEQLSGRAAAMDGDYVGKLERGVHRWPHKDYRRALCDVLHAASDAGLGFYDTRRRAVTVAGHPWEADEEVADVRRSEFLHLMGGLGVSAAFADPARLFTSPATGRIGMSEVALVRDVTVASRTLRETHGGAACSTIVAGQVRWATDLLGRPCTGAVRTEVHAAVGALASMAAYVEVDAGNPAAARGYHTLGLHCAQEAHSWGLRSEMLQDMGQAAIGRDQPDDGLSLIELAQVRADRVPPTGRVLLGATHAGALAATGRPAEAMDRLRAAEDQRTTITAVQDGRGSFFAEATALDLSCELTLAAVETAVRDVRFAPDALDRVQNMLDSPGLAIRSQARLTAKLADLALRAGEVERGLAATGRAITLSESVSSARLITDLRQLACTLAQQDDPEAREFAALLDARLPRE